jgi:hypothetical protein
MDEKVYQVSTGYFSSYPVRGWSKNEKAWREAKGVPMGMKSSLYNPEVGNRVTEWASVGVTQPTIAKMLGLSVEKLKQIYGKELEKGRSEGDGKLCNALFDEAVNKRNAQCLIFLGKTRLHLSETNKVEVTAKHKVVLFGEDDPVEAVTGEDGEE